MQPNGQLEANRAEIVSRGKVKEKMANRTLDVILIEKHEDETVEQVLREEDKISYRRGKDLVKVDGNYIKIYRPYEFEKGIKALQKKYMWKGEPIQAQAMINEWDEVVNATGEYDKYITPEIKKDKYGNLKVKILDNRV